VLLKTALTAQINCIAPAHSASKHCVKPKYSGLSNALTNVKIVTNKVKPILGELP
jgi:hypothetical protein